MYTACLLSTLLIILCNTLWAENSKAHAETINTITKNNY